MKPIGRAASAPKSPRGPRGERFSDLTGPVIRIGAPDIRVPAAPSLQKALIPEAEAIATEIRQSLATPADTRA